MYYTVYVHISPNGKRYFGITSQDKAKYRWNNGNGYKTQQYFWRAIQKYGWENFEHVIIAKGLTEEEAKWLEIELIREWDTTNPNKGYNLSTGGESASGYKMSKEGRKKISEARKGMKFTEEHKANLSKAHKDKTLNDEHRKKISENSKNKTAVYVVELDKSFDSIVDCAKYLGCHKGSISRVLNGGRETIYGYHVKYV